MNQLNIQLKVCSKCKESLSVEEFHKHSGNKDGLQHCCRSCYAEYSKVRHKRNTERNKGINNPLNVELKICCKCKESLPVEKFSKNSGNNDGLQTQCKSCQLENNKISRQRNTERNKGINNPLNIKFKVCYKCKESLPVEKFNNNFSNNDGLQRKCKSCEMEHYQDNKPKILERQKKYRRDNKPKLNEYHNGYKKNKRKTDPNFKAMRDLRYATWRLFKMAGKSKSKRSLHILGVSSYEDALSRLLKTMPEGYTLQDFLDGKLVIDHKIPLAWFDLTIESELMEAGNINNLQLLTKEQNQEKLDRYGHMPDGSIILYEDWVMTRGIKING